MKKAIVAIRGLDEEVYRKFKARTAEEKMRIGDALTEAMKKWIREREESKMRPDPRNLLKISGIIKTKKKVRWSEEIDEILYGCKK